MKTFFQAVGEVMGQGPGDRLDRLTPWILGVLGGGIIFLLLYTWLVEPHP